MKKAFEFEAKKVEEAIKKGLDTLQKTLSDVEVNIISSGGFFKKAKVEIIIDVEDSGEAVPSQNEAIASVVTSTTKEQLKQEKKEKKEQLKKEKTDKKEKAGKAEKKELSITPKTDIVEKKEIPAPATILPKKPLFAMKFDNAEKSVPSQTAMPQKQKGKARTTAPKTPRPIDGKERNPATEESAKAATDFLEGFLRVAKVEGSIKTTLGDELGVEIVTTDSCLIGHHGEALASLQYLTAQAVKGRTSKYTSVSLDTLGYREKRRSMLEKVATKAAQRCLANNRRMALEPMNAADRKTVHAFLNDLGTVATRSEGIEPGRRIVLYPPRSK